MLINVREDGIWGSIYPFENSTHANLLSIHGKENLRVISVEEWERYEEIQRQNQSLVDTSEPLSDHHEPNINKNSPLTEEEEERKPTIEELRQLRLAFFSPKPQVRRSARLREKK